MTNYLIVHNVGEGARIEDGIDVVEDNRPLQNVEIKDERRKKF
jgi:hypothetical protein